MDVTRRGYRRVDPDGNRSFSPRTSHSPTRFGVSFAQERAGFAAFTLQEAVMVDIGAADHASDLLRKLVVQECAVWRK
jgi:hypothetical protein